VKLAEPFTFFVDRSLGGAFVARALRENGRTVVVHDDEFEPDARDVDWLQAVGKQGWVVGLVLVCSATAGPARCDPVPC